VTALKFVQDGRIGLDENINDVLTSWQAQFLECSLAESRFGQASVVIHHNSSRKTFRAEANFFQQHSKRLQQTR
jgi:hypothetical protein